MNLYPKVIEQTFDIYAKSQLTFVQNVSELASKSSYIECLINNHVVENIMPLAINPNPTMRLNAVLSLARLAGNSESCVKQIFCSKNILSQIFRQIAKENKYYKKNCMNLIKNLCKYSSASSEIVIKECKGIDAVLMCMKDFDALVIESAMQVITYIARQDMNLLQLLVSSGILTQIVQCLKEGQQNSQLHALYTLDEIVKNNEDLAMTVVEVPSLKYVINFLSPNFTDVKVQKNALVLIKNIVKHSLFLTECAIESNLFPDILLLMAQSDECVRINAANVIQEVVKHSIQVKPYFMHYLFKVGGLFNDIAQLVVTNGGITSLLNVILCKKEFSPVSAILALGYIGAMSPLLASSVIQSNALTHFADILRSCDTDKYSKAGTIWALGMIGQHGPKYAKSVCAGDAIIAMTDIYIKKSNLESECRGKCRRALLQILNECDDYFVFDKLLKPSIPSDMFSFILDKINKIISKNSKARHSFVVNGHLKMIQNLRPEIDSDLYKIIQSINCCFSDDVLQMSAGDISETMKTMDKHVSQSQCLFYNHYLKSEELFNRTFISGKIHSSSDESYESLSINVENNI